MFSNQLNETIYPASLTKLMTALILLENYKLNDYIVTKYPPDYVNKGKVAYIPASTEISIDDLLKLLLIYSANDAAYISAMAVSENIDEFVNLMNNKANELNMYNTNFMNPDGIHDDDHYTTLNDLLILSLEVVDNIEIISIVSKTSFISDVTGKDIIYNTTNFLIKDGFIGLKTGWTDKAGLTFIGFNQTNNREIITIVNKSKVDENKYSHFGDTLLLYKTSIDAFNNFIILNKNQNLYNIRHGNSINYFKNSEEWRGFGYIENNYKIQFTNYKDNNLYFEYRDYKKSFKINNSKNTIKWTFDPLKVLNIFANQ